MNPTLSIVPPAITAAQATATINSVTVTVTFNQPTVHAGYLFAGALIKDTELVSVNQLVVAATSVQYLAGATTTTVTITGLSAVTDYDEYSYALSVAGYGNSLSDVAATLKGVRRRPRQVLRQSALYVRVLLLAVRCAQGFGHHHPCRD